MSHTLDAATLALEVAQRYGLTPRKQALIVSDVTEMAVYTHEEGGHRLRPILYVADAPVGGGVYSVTVHRGPWAAREMARNDALWRPVQFVDVMRGNEYDPADFVGVR